MTKKKLTGSYYTPSYISDFIVSYIFKKHNGKDLRILEPSAGDGVFIRSLYGSHALTGRVRNTVAVELDVDECEKIREFCEDSSLEIVCADFLSFQNKYETKEFDIVLGNPPYIKKNLMSQSQIELCQEIHTSYSELSNRVIKNIWSAFLVRSISLLKEGGVLSLVLPAELLQVNFTAELRKLLKNQFERIEIFTFNELLFKECKGQDTLILVAEKKSNNPGLFFHNVESLDELTNSSFSFISKDYSDDSKWTTHCLLQTEIDLLNKFKSKLQTVNDYCQSKAGIVTGANDYFIVSEDRAEEFNLLNYVRPIVKRGGFVSTWLSIDHDIYERLIASNLPCFLLDLNKVQIDKRTKLHSYLQLGETLGINNRFKTKIRSKWYEVPNIGVSAEAFFFKRCNDLPKLVVNSGNILATDSAYLVNTNEGVDIKSLVASFYNSLTLTFAELYGRFYGGGVLEITPNEFKRLPIPYFKISEELYSQLIAKVRAESSMVSVIDQMDNLVLKACIPDITSQEIESLKNIRQKLVARRKKLH